MLFFTALIFFISITSLAALTERELPAGCSQFTYGSCAPSSDELIDTYPMPNSEEADSICQHVCQIVEGCRYFTHNKDDETCYLYHYRYLDSCGVVGGLAEPSMDLCGQENEDTCDSFVKEECTYNGNIVFFKESVTDGHSCQVQSN